MDAPALVEVSRRCQVCKAVKPIDAFQNTKSGQNGQRYRLKTCRDCYNAAVNTRRQGISGVGRHDYPATPSVPVPGEHERLCYCGWPVQERCIDGRAVWICGNCAKSWGSR